MTGIPVDVAGQLDDFLRACRSSGGFGVTPGSQFIVGPARSHKSRSIDMHSK